jgi:O-antigen/teichoic acid export membrane protein
MSDSPQRDDAHRPPAFFRDLIFTVGTSVLSMVGIVVMTRVLAHGLGPELFGVYSLARRLMMALMPFATLSMGLAITRYVALANDEAARFRYIVCGSLLAVLPATVLFVILAPFAGPLSRVLFHNVAFSPVVVATLTLTLGYAVYTVLYSLYRSTGRMMRANGWNLAVVVFGPLLIAFALARSGRVAMILFLMAGLYFAAAVPVIIEVRRRLAGGVDLAGSLAAARDLFRYGAPRMPGYLARATLFLLAPFLASQLTTFEDVGYVAAGQSLIVLVGGLMMAFGLVALPKVARLLADGHDDVIRERTGNILAAVLHLGFFGTVQLALWSDALVLTWLGEDYSGAIPVFRVFACAMMPYSAYMMLNAVIDAVDERAVNAANLVRGVAVAIAVSLSLAACRMGAIGLAIGTTAGFTVLGVLTVVHVWRRFGVDRGQFHLWPCLWMNAAFAAVAWAVKYWADQRLRPTWLLATGLGVGILLAGVYVLVLRRRGAGWVGLVERRLAGLLGRGRTRPVG